MKSFTIILLLALLPYCSFAWGSSGHRIVDEIALKNIAPNIADSLHFYLGKHVADAGNWMDEIRGDHDYDYMKPWHYINVPKGGSYDPNSTNNIVSALDSAISRLHNRHLHTKEETATDLKIAMHLLGDLHQPLHVGYASDRGGNMVEVGFLGTTTNLHKVWDSEIIEHNNISASSCSVQPVPQSVEVLEWMTDSRALLNTVYSFSNATIDQTYEDRSIKLIEKQLALAGARLAAVITDIFY